MQTFLVGAWLGAVGMLDNKRLGKQRVEAMQILRVLEGKTKGWRNHPAVLMWYGHEACLSQYLNCCINEWTKRGFKNTMSLRSTYGRDGSSYWPSWVSDTDTFHRVIRSHRSNLLRKDPVFYGQYGWDVGPDLPYYWPVTKEEIAVRRVLEVCA
jgi:hypothetical protein